MKDDYRRLRFSLPMEEPEEQDMEDGKETSLFSAVTAPTDVNEGHESANAAASIGSGETEGLDSGMDTGGLGGDFDGGCDGDCDCGGGCDGGCGM